VGKFNGSLATVPAEGGAQAIKGTRQRRPGQSYRVTIGQILTASVGQNPARQALVRADIPDRFRR
jgi:acetyl-CoA C-acetyltransferase